MRTEESIGFEFIHSGQKAQQFDWEVDSINESPGFYQTYFPANHSSVTYDN